MGFIVIDGIDASGKSTQASKLRSFLRSKGKTVLLRFHPSDDNFCGAATKRFLYSSGRNAHFASAVFYMLDVLRSILMYFWQGYDYVIFVRYLMGTAYLPWPLDRIGYHFFVLVLPTSDSMFFLDVNPQEAYRRIRAAHGRLEMFEDVAELARIRGKALSLALLGRWRIIDAGKSEEEIAREIEKLFRLGNSLPCSV